MTQHQIAPGADWSRSKPAWKEAKEPADPETVEDMSLAASTGRSGQLPQPTPV